MASRDLLQPSLLDRLSDDEPLEKKESRDKRVLSFARLRECVIRDLAWLFNTSSLDSTEDLADTPLVQHSVVNYGIPALAGSTISNVEVPEIERKLVQAIADFEPRIVRKTLKVRVLVAEDGMDRNAVTFEIEGQLWAQPMPLRLLLRTDVDLETGSVTVSEADERGRT